MNINKEPTMLSFLPVDLSIDGEQFNRCLEYDSRNVALYKLDLRKLTWEMVERSKAEGEARRYLVENLRENLMRVNKFWHERIFTPVSKMTQLPQRSVCYCFKGHCPYDLFHSSHHATDCAKVKVDIFTSPPSISLNVAAQSEADIEKLRDFYMHTIRRWRQNPCCQCVPISQELLSIVSEMMSETDEILDEVVEEVVRAKGAVIV